MAATLLRTGRLNIIKFGSWSTLSRAPPAVAFGTKSESSGNCSQKKSSDKEQAKTYFDMEKLVQHKSYEVCPTTAATSAKPTEQNVPSVASSEPLATLSAVEGTEKVVEAAPSAKAVSHTSVTAEDTPVFEVPSAIKPVFESATTEQAFTAVSSTIVAAATEDIEVEESAAALAQDLAQVAASASGADAAIFQFPIAAATEVANKGEALEAAPLVEALSKLDHFKAPPLEEPPEPLVKVFHVDVGSEPMAEVEPVNTAEEFQSKAAPIDVATEIGKFELEREPSVKDASAVEAFEPLAETASIHVAPQLVEVVPANEAPPEASVPPEIVEEVVDHAPVVADASGEEMPMVEAEPANTTQELQSKAAPIDMTLEPATEIGKYELELEPSVKDASAVEAFEPLAKTASIHVDPQLVEVVPCNGAAPEVSVPQLIAEEVVDHAPVVSEASGEEMPKDLPAETSEAHMDPIQKLFLSSIREYSSKSQASGGLCDVTSDYEKEFADEIAKLQRLYGGGDLTSFPTFEFKEPCLDEVC